MRKERNHNLVKLLRMYLNHLISTPGICFPYAPHAEPSWREIKGIHTVSYKNCRPSRESRFCSQNKLKYTTGVQSKSKVHLVKFKVKTWTQWWLDGWMAHSWIIRAPHQLCDNMSKHLYYVSWGSNIYIHTLLDCVALLVAPVRPCLPTH